MRLDKSSDRERFARGGVMVGGDVRRLRALGMKRLKLARAAALALCGAALLAPQAASAGAGGTAQLPQNRDETVTAGQAADVIAVDVLGLSYREAGRLLRVREATITTRLHRARRLIARTLSSGDL